MRAVACLVLSCLALAGCQSPTQAPSGSTYAFVLVEASFNVTQGAPCCCDPIPSLRIDQAQKRIYAAPVAADLARQVLANASIVFWNRRHVEGPADANCYPNDVTALARGDDYSWTLHGKSLDFEVTRESSAVSVRGHRLLPGQSFSVPFSWDSLEYGRASHDQGTLRLTFVGDWLRTSLETDGDLDPLYHGYGVRSDEAYGWTRSAANA